MARLSARNRRRIVCVFARTPDGYGINHAYKHFRNISSFMVPQGVLTIAAYLPSAWDVRVIDEQVTPLRDSDIEWADAVFATGTHVQRHFLEAIATRTHLAGKLAVIGGPSVSACPDYYPTYDILHVGELGDATDELIAHVDRSVDRPAKQLTFTTRDRLPLDDFPIPAYDRIDFLNYYTATMQFSSGCPFTCDFCDIPELYGRNPRFKTPERVMRELDAIMAHNPVGAIYFVDDNLIGNKKAAKMLVSVLIDWQKKNGYRARFGAECTLNVALDRELLAMMREAHFTDLFFGIESPDEETLQHIDKKQNIRMPILEAIRIINGYGIELSAGMIFGLDNDGPDNAEKVMRFIEASKIPFVAPNILTALPKTPLWRRLEAEGRLRANARVEEPNIEFKLGEAAVLEQWRTVIERAYRPHALYERFLHQARHTYVHRLPVKLGRQSITREVLWALSYTLPSVLVRIGLLGDYRREFWRLSRILLSRADVGQWLFAATMGEHFIGFREDVLAGGLRHSIYGPRALPSPRRRRMLDWATPVLRLAGATSGQRATAPGGPLPSATTSSSEKHA